MPLQKLIWSHVDSCCYFELESFFDANFANKVLREGTFFRHKIRRMRIKSYLLFPLKNMKALYYLPKAIILMLFVEKKVTLAIKTFLMCV